MKRKLLLLFTSCFAFILQSPLVFADNMVIQNVLANNTSISFNLSWDNSWRSNAPSDNWDAIWIFVKRQDCSSGNNNWLHQDFKSTSGQHSATGTLQVDHVSDGKGVFVRRSTEGAGSASGLVTLIFDSPVVANILNFDVVGVEMVYVNQGEFLVGSTYYMNSSNNWVSSETLGSFGVNSSFGVSKISNENALIADAICSSTSTGTTSNSRHLTIGANFPKGYNAFYCMKFELTQGQYCHFLNRLSIPQQSNRTRNLNDSIPNLYVYGVSPYSTPINRNGLKIKSIGNSNNPRVYGMDLNNNNIYDELADGAAIAMNYLTFEDLSAYLDWAALRPMTELEYEKVARGPFLDPSDLYPWGRLPEPFKIGTPTIELSTLGTPSEKLTVPHIANVGLSLGPLRVGFSGTSGASRTVSGTSYYGAFDLIGNVSEMTVKIPVTGYNTLFDGKLGDGTLAVTGHTNEASWLNGTSVMLRGLSYSLSSNNFLSSIVYRMIGEYKTSTLAHYQGGRGVRQY